MTSVFPVRCQLRSVRSTNLAHCGGEASPPEGWVIGACRKCAPLVPYAHLNQRRPANPLVQPHVRVFRVFCQTAVSRSVNESISQVVTIAVPICTVGQYVGNAGVCALQQSPTSAQFSPGRP